MHPARTICAVLVLLLSPIGALAAPIVLHPAIERERGGGEDPGGVVVARLDHERLRAAERGARVIVEGLPLPGGSQASLRLTRFSVTTPATRFVIGSRNAPDVPLDFDPARIVLLRGTVEGEPHSHVFLALSDRYESTGRITLASGLTYGVSSRSTPTLALDDDQIALYPASTTPPAFLAPLLCGTPPLPNGEGEGGRGARPAPLQVRAGSARATPLQPRADRIGSPPRPLSPDTPVAPAGAPLAPLRLFELAIETDYEYFELFDDADAAAAYVVALYAVNADLFIRDLRSNLTLTFVRLWDDPDDLFNGSSPLSEFAAHWNEFMQDVQRDNAQFLSGRRDLGYGGIAFLPGVCSNGSGYSVSAYTLGFWGDLENPSVFNRDVVITAHELGHNWGTPHTHDLGIDGCNDPGNNDPQRGTIMSYCSQTWTGGSANIDLRFHTTTQQVILDFLDETSCWDPDHNLNGIPDAEDIASGASADANLDGIPDEAQDCNANAILDPEEIASGLAADADANGVPDDCQPDCNASGLPDGYDIEMGFSIDAFGDGVPDECEADTDADAVSDYTQIQADMSLDLNRNARLDSGEDCDRDGATDLDALDGAGDAWVAGAEHNALVRFLSVTGTAAAHADESVTLDFPSDVLITADRRVLVADSGADRIVEFTHDGAFVRELVPPGAGGLDKPGMMRITTDGRLLVTSRNTNSVLAYDPRSGAFLGELVPPGSGGLLEPAGLVLADAEYEGVLFVTSEDNRILRFDAQTGSFLGDFVSADQAGALDQPRGIMFLPNAGDLLVASHGSDRLIRYDRATGENLGTWNKNGTEDVLTMKRPWAIRLAPDGNVYASRFADEADPDGDFVFLHLTDARIHVFDPETGEFVRAFVQGANAEIEAATGFDFLPPDGTDCNLNLIPDACDIASGTSADADADGIPDECQAGCPADADADGELDVFDFIAFQQAFSAQVPSGDCDGNGAFDVQDFICFQLAFAEGCG